MKISSLFMQRARRFLADPLGCAIMLGLVVLSAFLGTPAAAEAGESLYIVGGAGGGGGACTGGAGGNTIVPGKFTLQGGKGSDNDGGGGGGSGGYIGGGAPPTGSKINGGNGTLTESGTGGRGYGGAGAGYNGVAKDAGAGGAAEFTAKRPLVVDILRVQGGVAGFDGDDGGGAGAGGGGAGGKAALHADAVDVVARNVAVATADHVPDTARNGDASFIAKSLWAKKSIELTRGAGEHTILFGVGELRLNAASPTAMTANKTLAEDIVVGALRFDLGDGSITDASLDIRLNTAERFSLKDAIVTLVFDPDAAVRINEDYVLITTNHADFEHSGQTTASAWVGLAKRYTFDLRGDAGNFFAKTRGAVRRNPGVKVIPQSRLATLLLLNDDAAWMDAAAQPILWEGCGWGKTTFWLAAAAGDQRLSAGKRLDVKGGGFRFGFSVRNRMPNGELVAGGFMETGYADYDGRSAGFAPNFRYAESDGNARHLGGGIFGRYEANGGIYADAAFRAGWVNNHFSSGTIAPHLGDIRFDTDNAYLGAHLGAGYKWRFGNDRLLDFSARYFWTRIDDSSTRLRAANTKLRLYSVDSHRVVTAARFQPFASSGKITPYVGAAFEYELDGDASARDDGLGYGSPTAKGGTGRGEVGVTYRTPNERIFVDLGARGHFGKRDGVEGTFRMGVNF